jgi:hypothetical protein
MFRQKWLLGVVAFDGLAIIALAVYLFINFSSLTLKQGIILIILAGLIMLSVIVLMIYLMRRLASYKKAEKNAPHSS